MPSLASFERDPKKVADGVWFHLGENGYVKIRPWMNPEHTAKLAKIARDPRFKDDDAWQQSLRAAGGTVLVEMGVPPKGTIDMYGRAIEHAEPWTDPDSGKPLKFTEELAERLMTEERYETYRKLVVQLANDYTTWRAEKAKASAGN